MDCPHCRAALPEAAAACPACGVDLVKLKARDLLAKLKAAAPRPAAGEPPWQRSAVFLAALAAGACLLLYGSALIAGRRAGGGPAAAVPSEAPAEAAAEAVSEAAAPPALPPLGDRRPPPAPETRPSLNVVYFDGSARSQPPPPPPAPPR